MDSRIVTKPSRNSALQAFSLIPINGLRTRVESKRELDARLAPFGSLFAMFTQA
jgi:hypothetical protein